MPEQNEEQVTSDTKGSLKIRFLALTLSLSKAVLNKWKEAIVVAIFATILGYATSLWEGIRDHYLMSTLPLTDIKKILIIARNTPVGHSALMIAPYYFLHERQQYLAIAYYDSFTIFVQAYKVLNGNAFTIGKPIPVSDGYLLNHEITKPGVFFSQKSVFSSAVDLAPTISTEFENEENETPQIAKERLALRQKAADYLSYYFGFVDANEDNRLEMYSTYIIRNTAEVDVRIFVSDLIRNQWYQAKNVLLPTGQIVEPIISVDLIDVKMKNWLIEKLADTIENGASPLDTEIAEEEGGTEVVAVDVPDGDSESVIISAPLTEWFNENGRNATVGNLVPIKIPEPSQYIKEESYCTITDGNKTYFVQFKNGVMEYNDVDHSTRVLYMPDPENFREPGGMVNGKSFLWLGIILSLNESAQGNEKYILAMKKNTQSETNKFVKVKVKVQDEQNEDIALSGAMEDYLGTTGFNLNENMTVSNKQKDYSLSDFRFEDGEFVSDIGTLSFEEESIYLSGGETISVQEEFLHASNCVSLANEQQTSP